MSIANEHPEMIAHPHEAGPRVPPDRVFEEMLGDFIRWMRAAKGIRVCVKDGTDSTGRSVYSRASQQLRREAVSEFVNGMSMPPYRPPAPLLQADDSIPNPLPDAVEGFELNFPF